MSGAADVTRYCTFHLAGLYMGIDVTRVQEVLRAQETTPVPLTTPVVGGLMNLRGEIVTTVDLRWRLDLEPRSEDRESMNVVIRNSDGVASLLVDEIDDVIDVDDETFEPAPSTLPAALQDLLLGVYKLDGRLLLVLDAERVSAVPAHEVVIDELV